MYRLHGFYTQNSLKALYVLEELGVDFEFHYVDLFKGEHRGEAFRRMTPVGKVPVLEHDGSYLFESGAICRYLANAERSPLYPADPKQRAQVDQWLDFFANHIGRWLTTLYFERLLKPQAGLGPTNEPACEEAERFAHQQLKMLERSLEGSEYLANNALSIADLFGFALAEQIWELEFPVDDYPRVTAGLERIAARDCVARARARLAAAM